MKLRIWAAKAVVSIPAHVFMSVHIGIITANAMIYLHKEFHSAYAIAWAFALGFWAFTQISSTLTAISNWLWKGATTPSKASHQPQGGAEDA